MSKREIISVITGSIIMFASVWKLATDKQARTKLAKLFNVIPTPHNPKKTAPPRARETHIHSQNIFENPPILEIAFPVFSQSKADIPSEPDKKAKSEAPKNFGKKFIVVDRASGNYYVGLHTDLSGKPFVSKWRESAKIFTNRVEATEAKIIMLFNGAIDPQVMEVK